MQASPKALWGPKGDTPTGTGYALHLDGVDDYASPELGGGDRQWTFGPDTPSTDFSFSAWVKPAGGRRSLILAHSHAGGSLVSGGWFWWAEKVEGRDCPRFSYRLVLPPPPENNWADQESLCPTGTEREAGWAHWVLTYQADDGAGNAVVRHYLNGELKATDLRKQGSFTRDFWHQLNLVPCNP